MTQPACNASDPNEVLKGMQVTLRGDIRATRQVHQGEPVYVLHDPISFQTHRLSVFQYRTLASLDPDRKLSENFEALCAKGEFDPSEEDLFLQLVMSFQRLGLIVLPMANGPRLFETHEKMNAMKRRGKLLGILFMQIPLVRPDAFLSRTMNRMGWLFTKLFMVVWFMGLLAAGYVVINRSSDLLEPLNGILALKNLPFLWASFVGLKVWHELGHGYACKKFGGFVPEMGTILIAGTPAAYVDASSAWSFPERWKRLAVMCGGMFFESLVFIPCVFIWAFSDSPMFRSCAYQLFVMASLVTVLFNANPLMKFDGYFILSELLGIQNLRPRADKMIKSLMVRAIGLPAKPTDDTLLTKALLVLYGVAATIYKFTLIISIAVMVAMKFPLIGLAMAAFHVLTSVGMSAIKLYRYLMKSEETEPYRWRTRAVAAAVFIGLPIAAIILPMPLGVVSQGVVAADGEVFLNVDSPGEFDQAMVKGGAEVAANTPLVKLVNKQLDGSLTITKARLEEARTRWQLMQDSDPALAAQQRTEVQELVKQVAELQQQADSLVITSPQAGQVVRLISDSKRGSFLVEGTPLAVVVDGRPILRTWLNEDQLGSIQREPGTEVTIRVGGRSTDSTAGKILKVEPAAEDRFSQMALTYVGGGEILVDPSTMRPLEPLFQVDIETEDDAFLLSEHGTRVSIRFPGGKQTVAGWTWRKLTRFAHKLWVG